jgi:hypothetical protein
MFGRVPTQLVAPISGTHGSLRQPLPDRVVLNIIEAKKTGLSMFTVQVADFKFV